MKRSIWKLGALAVMAAAATALLSPALAAPTITLVPSIPTVTAAGDAVGVDIVVDGLPSASGGFSLDLEYGNLVFVDYILGPGGTLGDPSFFLDLSLGDVGGKVSLAALADFLITEGDLFAAQKSGGAFTIAHVNFTGVAPGAFTQALAGCAVISNFSGTGTLVSAGSGCPGTTVPEPATAWLAALALGSLALSRRQLQT